VTEKKLAALYCRVSSPQRSRKDSTRTEGETDPLKSTARQEVICRDLCLKQGLEVAGVYTETRSATSDDLADRPEFERLLKDAEAGKFSYLVAFHGDRVTRNMDTGSDIGKRLRNAGVVLITPQGATDFHDRASKLVYAVQSWSSEGEAERIATRTWGAKKARGKAGLFAFRNSPYGYSWDAKAAKPLPIPEELETVTFIFELAAKGNTSDQIAKLLNGAGYRPRKVKRWSGSWVALMLGDERYAGTWPTWSGAFPVPPTGKRRASPYIHRDPADEGKEWLARPDLTPEAAIPRKLWRQAQKAKRHHRKHPRREVQQSFLLSAGVARCTCGNALVGRVISGEPARRYYACSMAVRSPDTKSDCPAGYIAAGPLEQQVWSYVERLIADPDLLRRTAAITEAGQLPEKQAELKRLKRTIAECEQQKKAAMLAYETGDYTLDEFADRKRTILADLAEWERLAAEAQAYVDDREARAAAVDAAAELLEAARGRCASLDERKRLLQLLDFRVEVGCADWTAKAREREYTVALDCVLFAYDPAVTGVVSVAAVEL
jgi:DNA invertase Pin-like site-specific DNA recombinase